jgi:hypothetical protein
MLPYSILTLPLAMTCLSQDDPYARKETWTEHGTTSLRPHYPTISLWTSLRRVSKLTAWSVACGARVPCRVLYMMIRLCSTIPRIPNCEEQTVIEFGSGGVQ